MTWLQRQRAIDMGQGLRGLLRLQQQHAQQVPGIGVRGLLAKQLLIERACGRQLPLLMPGQGLLQSPILCLGGLAGGRRATAGR